MQLVNPDTGNVFGFPLPLPPAIRKQVDAGYLIEPGAEIESELAEHETVPKPRGNASVTRWIAYAVSQGLPAAEAAQMARDEIRARFTDPRFQPDKPPELED